MPEHPSGDRAHSPNERLLHVVNRLARSLNHASDDVALRHDLSLPQLMMMLVLGEDVGLSNAQLARRTFVTSQSAHRVVGQLVDRGLVELGPHPTNRKVRVARLTEAGWRDFESCRRDLAETEQKIYARLGPRERRALLPAMTDAADAMRGGWFGDLDAERAALARRSGRAIESGHPSAAQ